ncbi:MAG: hypothetical protein K1X42_08195 [Opitutaceae bacterium]|nr:hypothetical protein [Opitutaceae bacterium]
MPSLLKRKTEKGQMPLVPAWHPNFRNFDRLPDTKAVRTSFFVNGVAVVIAISLLLVFAYQEYALFVLNRQIIEWQARIDGNQKASALAVVEYKKFQAEEKKIAELEAFVSTPKPLSVLLLDLSRTLPPRIALLNVIYRLDGVNLRGVVRGAGDRASGEVASYVQKLKKEPAFSTVFDSISQSALGRDSQGDRLSFELFMKYKGAAAPAKK